MGMFGKRDSLEGPELAGPPSESKRANLIVGLIAVAFFFLLEVLSWFTESGGIFSVLSALAAVHSKPPVVDIDENGLLFPIVIVVWLTGVGLCRLFDIHFDMSSRWKALLPIVAVIGGGFFLSAAYGEPIITRYMVSHGYRRCEDGDWAQGNGKSRVWFADYVFQGVECRRRRETTEDRLPYR